LGNQDPQLSLLSGTIAPSADGHSLVVTLKVEDLSATVPIGATDAAWVTQWTYKGTTYFASVQLGVGGILSYGDGTWSSSSGYAEANTDTGTFNAGPGGTVVVNVPLANVGAPPAGAVFSQPAGKTFIGEGVPPTPATSASGLQLTVDTGGPHCDATA
jgi:hypothetical protein